MGLTTELSGGGPVGVEFGNEALSRHPLQRFVSKNHRFIYFRAGKKVGRSEDLQMKSMQWFVESKSHA
jgi:hypothetical protein